MPVHPQPAPAIGAAPIAQALLLPLFAFTVHGVARHAHRYGSNMSRLMQSPSFRVAFAISRVAAAMLIALAIGGVAHAQHDGQRNAVQQIARSKPDAAAKRLREKGLDDVPETRFVEMLSLLDQDRPEEALANAKQAVDAGLPINRLVAGPRQLLDRLHALPEFRSWLEDVAPPPLVHGPMVGSVTDRSASFWMRTADAMPVTVSLWPADADDDAADDDATPAATASGETSRELDLTAIVTVDGLQPDTTYRYAVEVDGETMELESTRFRTFPSQRGPGKFAVAFGGGAGYIPEWERMWDNIATFDPIAMLMLGDNVYIDDPTHPLTQDYCYYRRQSRPEWRRLTASRAIYSIYDDHDFGDNDCIPGPDRDRPAWKRPVLQTFRNNWVNPGYGGGEADPGCWYDFRIADVHFVMLDGRYYRDLESKSMLGPVQKKWLLDTLADSDATFKVICSPVPFTPGIKPGSKDPWDGYPEEREEIFRFIESESIEGVFLVAADRHRSDLRRIDRPNGYTLYEFESSRLTNRHTHNVVKTDGLVWGYNETCSFGLMSFDTSADDPEVTFTVIDIDGNRQATHTLRRSELQK